MKALACLVLLTMLLAVQSQGDSCGMRKIATNATANVSHPSPANANHLTRDYRNVSQSSGVDEEMNRNTTQANAGKTTSDPMSESSKSPQRVAPGTWGGTHIRMEVRADGADIEYD